MPYPSTKFKIVDNSDIPGISVLGEDTADRPVYMCVFSSDKGTEDWQEMFGMDFYDMYITNPTTIFDRHGQTLLQAAAIINEGGRLFCKRIVDTDPVDGATLANTLISAKVDKIIAPKKDENGNILYHDIEIPGGETTDISHADTTIIDNPEWEGDPVLAGAIGVAICTVDFIATSIAIQGNNLKTFMNAARDTASYTTLGNPGVYPLFMIFDNGRGESNKSFRIQADTNNSRPVDYIKYILTVYESGEEIDTIGFTMNPNVIESSNNISLDASVQRDSKQIRAKSFPDIYADFVANVAYIAGYDQNDTYQDYGNCDIFANLDLWGRPLPSTIVNQNSGTWIADSIIGTPLANGSNGSWGNSPTKATTYEREIMNAFTGKSQGCLEPDQIYDLDNTRIDVIFDANYSDSIKRKIEEFVEFRDDVFYFRDMGIGLENIAQIKLKDSENLHSRLIASYHNSWDIIDPFSRKQITVTSTYNLAVRMVQHFIDGRNRPFCGQLYNITFPEVIKGTVNFVPKITPADDQKQTIDDLRINYAGYYKGLLTMETDYTSQTRYTQLSWLHNVMLIQHLIKAIRERCPKIRYNFADGDALKKYQDDVQVEINKFNTSFLSITMKYADDKIYRANKIFYAVIEVQLRDFFQSEFFKITVLPIQ